MFCSQLLKFAGSILFGLAFICNAIASENVVDFDRDVLPILSDRCFLCHGPDTGTNESGLRLDSFSEATKELSGGEGHAIVPGQPQSSGVVHRVETDDESLKMPPPESNLQLNEKEIEIIKAWIEQGAQYKTHWAFEPLPATVDPSKNKGCKVGEQSNRFVRSTKSSVSGAST